MNIRADLLARLYAIHSFFFAQLRQVPLYRYPGSLTAKKTPAEVINPFQDMDTETSSGSSGSGTTTSSTGAAVAQITSDSTDSGDSSSSSGGSGIFTPETNTAENSSATSNIQTYGRSARDSLNRIIAKSRQKLKDLIKKDDSDSDDSGDGGGGGTITGLRVVKPIKVNNSRSR